MKTDLRKRLNLKAHTHWDELTSLIVCCKVIATWGHWIQRLTVLVQSSHSYCRLQCTHTSCLAACDTPKPKPVYHTPQCPSVHNKRQ